MLIFGGTEPCRVVLFSSPVAVFGHRQPVFVQPTVDNKLNSERMAMFCGPVRMDKKKRRIRVDRCQVAVSRRSKLCRWVLKHLANAAPAKAT